MLVDRVLGEEREVDILVETQAGTRKLVVGVECRGGRSRPADVAWVEEIACKHRDLPIDRTVLVSRTGFTLNALKKAEGLGLHAISLSQAPTPDFRAAFTAWPATLEVTRARPLEARVIIDCHGEHESAVLAGIDQALLAETTVYASAGTALRRFQDLVTQALNHEEIQDEAKHNPLPGHDGIWVLPIELCDLENAFVLPPSQERVTFKTVRVLGLVTYDVTEVPWEKSTYEGARVMYTQIPYEGSTVTVVAAEPVGRGGKVQMFLEQPATRELKFRWELAKPFGDGDKP